MNTIIQKINNFKKLKDGWNGNDSKAIDIKIINNALDLAKVLPYKDKIFPNPNNSIEFEYNYNGKYLEIEVLSDRYEIYIKELKQEKNIVFKLDKLYEIVNIIKLFFNPKLEKAVLFTGAFNPITIAHYHMCHSAIKYGKFDYIIFALSNQEFLDKKQKKNNDFAYSEKERLDFILAATYHNPNVLIFGIEEGYTYEVLCKVKEKYKCKDLYFALGSDKLQEIGRWGHSEKLLKQFNFYILERNDKKQDILNNCKNLFKNTNYIIAKDELKYKDISATIVRNKIKNNEDFSSLVPNRVYEIIKSFSN